MTNALIADRDCFAAAHPETRIALGGREWGYVAAGNAGPALLLIPGTPDYGNIPHTRRAPNYWPKMEDPFA